MNTSCCTVNSNCQNQDYDEHYRQRSRTLTQEAKNHRLKKVPSFLVFCILACTANTSGNRNVDAFIHSPVFPRFPKSWSSQSSPIRFNPSLIHTLQMARRPNSASSSKKNRKKKNNTQMGKKDAKKKGKKKQQQNSSQNDNVTNQNRSNSQHLPPWQIMSTKDVKENIESEKQRRESIRAGEIASSITASTEKVSDINASSSLLTETDRKLLTWKRFSPDKDVLGMKFIGGYLGRELPPQMGCPEVAFLGRSNVGKSSLLNKLIKRVSEGGNSANDSARVGKTPGATASVNIYNLQGKIKNRSIMGFADLPGFGYAKLSKDVKESVEMAAERYLGKRRELALGILLVDVRRVPSDDDRAVLAALYDMGVPILVVATKIDKIRSKTGLSDALEKVRIGLGLPQGQPFHVSSMTGEGIKPLWGIIMDACEDKVFDLRERIEGTNREEDREIDPDDTILLDDKGNFIEEEEEYNDEGLEWVQSFAYYDESKENTNTDYQLSEESMEKMRQNEVHQAAVNQAMKLKSLKKVSRKLERKGDV